MKTNSLVAVGAFVALAAAAAVGPGLAARSAKADADIQAVLDAHSSLTPKPIDKLSAAEARKQPTPADAVNVVLRKKGHEHRSPGAGPGPEARRPHDHRRGRGDRHASTLLTAPGRSC